MSFEPEFDFSEVDKLVADLGEVPKRVHRLVEKAVEITAIQLRNDWQNEARRNGGGHARFYGSSITYSMERTTGEGVGAEIGPVLGSGKHSRFKHGGLGFLEEATGGVIAKPQRNVDRALRNNLADFERGILMAGEEAFDA